MEVWQAVWSGFNTPLFSLGGDPITPLSILVLIIIILMTWIIAGRARWLLERRVSQLTGMDLSLIHI